MSKVVQSSQQEVADYDVVVVGAGKMDSAENQGIFLIIQQVGLV